MENDDQGRTTSGNGERDDGFGWAAGAEGLEDEVAADDVW